MTRTSHRAPTRVADLVEGLRNGHRASLGRALTLVESRHASDMEHAAVLLDACLPFCDKARSLAVTGVPGAGKSTLVDDVGMRLVEAGHRVAVLAVDPSSLRTGGSILGDKTRMERLSRSEAAFIRPSPTSGALGGVAAHTRRSMILCAAAGYDRIVVETVGVGQSEVAVAALVQCVVLVLLAGAGDGLQGIKRGVLEIPDIVVFNKEDVVRKELQETAIHHTADAMHIMRPDLSVPVFGTSATTGHGMERLLHELQEVLETSRRPFLPDTSTLFKESVEQLIAHALERTDGPFRPLLDAAHEQGADDGPWRAATWFYRELSTKLSKNP